MKTKQPKQWSKKSVVCSVLHRQLEALGIRLAEGKAILANLQESVVAHQVADHMKKHEYCGSLSPTTSAEWPSNHHLSHPVWEAESQGADDFTDVCVKNTRPKHLAQLLLCFQSGQPPNSATYKQSGHR
jgi:hypothetical protein